MNREDAHLDQCTQEHLPQAISYLDSDEWLQLFHQPDPSGINNLRIAVSTVLSAIMGMYSVPQPDPETGLVRCGCKGKPEYHSSKYGYVASVKMHAECPDCHAKTAEYYAFLYSDDAFEVLQRRVMDAWNTMRGYKK